MKLSIKDFVSKCDPTRRFLCIWLHWLKKSLMEYFSFSAVFIIIMNEQAKTQRSWYVKLKHKLFTIKTAGKD